MQLAAELQSQGCKKMTRVQLFTSLSMQQSDGASCNGLKVSGGQGLEIVAYFNAFSTMHSLGSRKDIFYCIRVSLMLPIKKLYTSFFHVSQQIRVNKSVRWHWTDAHFTSYEFHRILVLRTWAAIMHTIFTTHHYFNASCCSPFSFVLHKKTPTAAKPKLLIFRFVVMMSFQCESHFDNVYVHAWLHED